MRVCRIHANIGLFWKLNKIWTSRKRSKCKGLLPTVSFKKYNNERRKKILYSNFILRSRSDFQIEACQALHIGRRYVWKVIIEQNLLCYSKDKRVYRKACKTSIIIIALWIIIFIFVYYGPCQVSGSVSFQ